MAAVQTAPYFAQAHRTVFVDTFTDGLLGPEAPMLGPVADGGHIVVNTTPGLLGADDHAAIRGGHEVTLPVAVAGAEVGDAIAIRIRDIEVTSIATWSGNDRRWRGASTATRTAPRLPGLRHSGRRRGGGHRARERALRQLRRRRGALHLHPRLHDRLRRARALGVTVGREEAEGFARDAARFAALPDGSAQNPILDVRAARPRRARHAPAAVHGAARNDTVSDDPRLAQRRRLRRLPHRRAAPLRDDRRRARAPQTDGHMDIDAVRAGAILVCPVKVAGGGVYMGDMHALQGDGEIAGHTCDVAGTVTLQVEVLKGLGIDGPVLFPVAEDLPFLARPLTAAERARAAELGRAPRRGRARGRRADLGRRQRP